MDVEDSSTITGAGLPAGSRHYRAFVGPAAEYDLIGSSQVFLLVSLGLRDSHKVADIGCGSLRGGRLLIPYLLPGHYYGVEPEKWLVEEGIRRELGDAILSVKRPTFLYCANFCLEEFGTTFDFVLAQSIFSHTYKDQLDAALHHVSNVLAPKGRLVATFVEDGMTPDAFPPGSTGKGWEYPGCVTYTWKDFGRTLSLHGFAGARLSWPHPRQTWVLVGSKTEARQIRATARAVRSPNPSLFAPRDLPGRLRVRLGRSASSWVDRLSGH